MEGKYEAGPFTLVVSAMEAPSKGVNLNDGFWPHSAFVVARNMWLLGEYASRRDHWGTQAIPTVWLRRQIPLMRSWLRLRPPG